MLWYSKILHTSSCTCVNLQHYIIDHLAFEIDFNHLSFSFSFRENITHL